MSKGKGKRKKQRRAERRARAQAPPRPKPERRPEATPEKPRPKRSSSWRWAVLAVVVVVAGAAAWYVLQRPASEAVAASDWGIPDPDTSEMGPPVARAIATARQAVIAQPDSAAAWGQLGSVFDAHELYDLAVVCYEHARELDPSNFRWPYLLGMVRDFRGEDLDAVLESFEAAIRLSPDSPAIYFRYGDALTRQGTPERARDAFLEVLEIAPDLTLAHRSLGQVYLSMDDPDSAARHLERAAEQSSQDPVVFSTLARAYKMLGDDERAAQAATKAGTVRGSSILPDPVRAEVVNLAVDPRSCARRAENLMRRGQFAEAIRYLELFEEASPDHPIAQFQLGTAYLRTGQPDLAIPHLAKAVDLKSDLVPARFQLASLYQSRGQLSGAIEQLRGVIAHAPDHGQAHMMLAILLGGTGDPDGAVAEFERAAELMPPNADLHYNWGSVLERAGRKDEAAMQYRRAVQLDPRSPAGARLNALGS